VGAILGGLACPLLLSRVTKLALLSAGCLIAAGGFALMSVPQLAFVMAGVVLVGVALAFANVPAMTIIEQESQAAVIGRVSTAFDMLTTIPYVLCIAVGAGAALAVGYRVPLALMALLCGAASLYSRPRHNDRGTRA
jgi:hypothetical protein